MNTLHLKFQLSSFRLSAPAASDLPSSSQLRFTTTTNRLSLTDTPVVRLPKSTSTPTTAPAARATDIHFPANFRVTWHESLPDTLALRAAKLRIHAVRNPRRYDKRKQKARISSNLSCGLPFRTASNFTANTFSSPKAGVDRYEMGSIEIDFFSMLHGTVAHAVTLKGPHNQPTKFTLYFNVVVEQSSRFLLSIAQLQLDFRNLNVANTPSEHAQMYVSLEYPDGKTNTQTPRKRFPPASTPDENEQNTTVDNSSTRVSWPSLSPLIIHTPSLYALAHSSLKLLVQTVNESDTDTTILTVLTVPLHDIWGVFMHPKTPYLHTFSATASSSSSPSMFESVGVSFSLTCDKRAPAGQLVGGVTTDDAIVGANTVVFSSPIPDTAKFPANPTSPDWLYFIDSFGSPYYHNRSTHSVVWTSPVGRSGNGSSRQESPQERDNFRARQRGYVCVKRSLYYHPVQKRHVWIHPDAVGNGEQQPDTTMDDDKSDDQHHQGDTRISRDNDDDNSRSSSDRQSPRRQRRQGDDENDSMVGNVPIDSSSHRQIDRLEDSLEPQNQLLTMSRNTSFSISTVDVPDDVHPSNFSQRFEAEFSHQKLEALHGGGSSSNNTHSRNSTEMAHPESGSNTDSHPNQQRSNDHSARNTRHHSTLSSSAHAPMPRSPIVEMSWKLLAHSFNMPGEGVEGHSLTPVDNGNSLLRFGGALGQGRKRTNALYRFDVAKLQWESVKACGMAPDPRTGHGAVSLGDDQSRLLVFGGTSSTRGARNDLHVFHTQTSTWTSIGESEFHGTAPGARARMGMTSFAHNSSVYVYGGRSLYRWLGGRYYDTGGTVHMFDSEKLVWTAIEQNRSEGKVLVPRPRSGCSLQALTDNRLMMMYGGYDDGDAFFNDTFIFDTRSAKWYDLPYSGETVHTPTARESHAHAIFPDNSVVIVGGDGKSNLHGDVHVFDGNSLRWVKRPQLAGHGPSRVVGAAMAPLRDDTMLLTGGEDGFQALSSCYTLSVSHRSIIGATDLTQIAKDRGPDAATCVVCLDAPVQCIFLWCGHSVCCASCAKLVNKVCPICRKKFSKTVMHNFDSKCAE